MLEQSGAAETCEFFFFSVVMTRSCYHGRAISACNISLFKPGFVQRKLLF